MSDDLWGADEMRFRGFKGPEVGTMSDYVWETDESRCRRVGKAEIGTVSNDMPTDKSQFWSWASRCWNLEQCQMIYVEHIWADVVFSSAEVGTVSDGYGEQMWADVGSLLGTEVGTTSDDIWATDKSRSKGSRGGKSVRQCMRNRCEQM